MLLIGHVATPARGRTEGVEFLLATVRSIPGRDVVERHLVRAPEADVAPLATGTLVLVEGSLMRDPERRRHKEPTHHRQAMTVPGIFAGLVSALRESGSCGSDGRPSTGNHDLATVGRPVPARGGSGTP